MTNDWTVDDGKKQVAALLMLCRLFREEVQDTYPDGKDYFNTDKLAEILGAAPSSPSEKHGWRVVGCMMGPVQ